MASGGKGRFVQLRQGNLPVPFGSADRDPGSARFNLKRKMTRR